MLWWEQQKQQCRCYCVLMFCENCLCWMFRFLCFVCVNETMSCAIKRTRNYAPASQKIKEFEHDIFWWFFDFLCYFVVFVCVSRSYYDARLEVVIWPHFLFQSGTFHFFGSTYFGDACGLHLGWDTLVCSNFTHCLSVKL